MKQKKLIFNFFGNRNWKKLADSRKKAKILADNRKCHHPIETLYLYSIYMGIRRKMSEISGICLFLVTHFESWADASSF